MLTGKKIGFALTGSFCTLAKTMPQLKKLVDAGAQVTPIVSSAVAQTDTRFGKAAAVGRDKTDHRPRTLAEHCRGGTNRPKALLGFVDYRSLYRKYPGEIGTWNHRFCCADGCQSAAAQQQASPNRNLHKRCFRCQCSPAGKASQSAQHLLCPFFPG